MTGSRDSKGEYREGSLSLLGAVAMGTGVMIGAGILALTGQIAELAGELFPLAFVAAAVVAAFSAYSYVRFAHAYPSAGGIAMFLKKAYGKTVWTGGFALLMFFSMVINESLVARTFGTYALQPFGGGSSGWLVPALGVGVLVLAFAVNLLRNEVIESVSFVAAFIKIGGLLVFAVGILAFSGLSFEGVSVRDPAGTGIEGFLGAAALGVLAYKGFTTITNSGDEVSDPRKSIGRAIMLSLAVCLALYLLVSLAVGSQLDVGQIVEAKDYALAQAARPLFGEYGVWYTVAFAVVATVSGLIASVFAVSRMLAMLTKMGLAPYHRLGLPGSRHRHTLIYTIALAMLLTVFFDLSRIAALGAVFYLVMDIAIHWGALRRVRREIGARAWVVITAIALDALVLGAFILVKLQSDMLIVIISAAGIAAVFVAERVFLALRDDR